MTLTTSEILIAYINRSEEREQAWLTCIGLNKHLYELYLLNPNSLELILKVQEDIDKQEESIGSYKALFPTYEEVSKRMGGLFGNA